MRCEIARPREYHREFALSGLAVEFLVWKVAVEVGVGKRRVESLCVNTKGVQSENKANRQTSSLNSKAEDGWSQRSDSKAKREGVREKISTPFSSTPQSHEGFCPSRASRQNKACWRLGSSRMVLTSQLASWLATCLGLSCGPFGWMLGSLIELVREVFSSPFG